LEGEIKSDAVDGLDGAKQEKAKKSSQQGKLSHKNCLIQII
jgi:hypothetical protein